MPSFNFCMKLFNVCANNSLSLSLSPLVTETAYYVHIVLALHLFGVTADYYLRIFAFYVQCLTVAGVSHPSSNVARKIQNFTRASKLLGIV